DIPPGQDFAKEISAGIRNCSVVIAILTDHYTSRPWCLEEILQTKTLQQRGPLVVIDALESGEPRSFPWLGNAPVVVWKPQQTAGTCRTILWQSVREALRFHLNSLLLQQTAAQLPPTTRVNVLPSSPEPADLTKIQFVPDQRHCIL
ncbi:MAG: toll/interleukin-1 receptor domain-containing protein, partial [Planctomyces sp.]